MDLCVGGNCAKWKEIKALQDKIDLMQEAVAATKEYICFGEDIARWAEYPIDFYNCSPAYKKLLKLLSKLEASDGY